MTSYIKDLIDLPDKVHGGDFVLKLTEGVEHPEETLRPYVVTPELARNFDDALDFIKGAIQTSRSKAAYLHGSFGSGPTRTWHAAARRPLSPSMMGWRSPAAMLNPSATTPWCSSSTS